MTFFGEHVQILLFLFLNIWKSSHVSGINTDIFDHYQVLLFWDPLRSVNISHVSLGMSRLGVDSTFKPKLGTEVDGNFPFCQCRDFPIWV